MKLSKLEPLKIYEIKENSSVNLQGGEKCTAVLKDTNLQGVINKNDFSHFNGDGGTGPCAGPIARPNDGDIVIASFEELGLHFGRDFYSHPEIESIKEEFYSFS